METTDIFRNWFLIRLVALSELSTVAHVLHRLVAQVSSSVELMSCPYRCFLFCFCCGVGASGVNHSLLQGLCHFTNVASQRSGKVSTYFVTHTFPCQRGVWRCNSCISKFQLCKLILPRTYMNGCLESICSHVKCMWAVADWLEAPVL